MSIRKITALCAATAFAAIGFAAPASAQATRTWVSGVGDDVNPCSRTAPCKTFAGAISKTAAGGEINCLDPGGFGAVTITKSLTIDCHFTEGGALAGGNGIVVNALSTDVVTLRGLDIFGVSPPSNGVRILVAAAVHIEDCVIRRFNTATSYGISFQPSGATQLFVSNSKISSNGASGGGGGILVSPTGASGIGRVTLSNVTVEDNPNHGIFVDMTAGTNAGSTMLIDQTTLAGNGNGISVLSNGTTVNIMMSRSNVSNNSLNGIIGNGPVFIRVGGTSITGNSFTAGSAVVGVNGAAVHSYTTNQLDGNNNNGAFTFNIPLR